MPSLLPEDWDVPAVFRERLGARVGRQRVMSEDGHLLLVLHVPPEQDDTERRGRFFWRRPDGTWETSTQGGVQRSLASHLSDYSAILEVLDDEGDRASSSQEYFAAIRKILPVQRAAKNLYAALQEARDLLPDVRDVIDFRDTAYQISRNFDLLYVVAKEALEFETARQSELLAVSSHQMSASAHRLNTLAGLFFPIVTLAGIFGMNFKHGFEETAWPIPFIGTVVLGLVLGCAVTGLLARRARRAD